MRQNSLIKFYILSLQLLLQITIPPAFFYLTFISIANMWEQGGSGLIAGFIAFAAWLLSDFATVPILSLVFYNIIKLSKLNGNYIKNISIGIIGGILAIILPILILAITQ